MNQECKTEFLELKLKKAFKYIIYQLSADSTQIVVGKTSNSDDYDTFLADLPKKECRYAVYDLQYTKPGAGTRNKITFFTWCVVQLICQQGGCEWLIGWRCCAARSSDEAKVKDKMLYASSKERLRLSLVGLQAEIQGAHYSEVDYETGSSLPPSLLYAAALAHPTPDLYNAIRRVVVERVSKGA